MQITYEINEKLIKEIATLKREINELCDLRETVNERHRASVDQYKADPRLVRHIDLLLERKRLKINTLISMYNSEVD